MSPKNDYKTHLLIAPNIFQMYLNFDHFIQTHDVKEVQMLEVLNYDDIFYAIILYLPS